MSKLLLGVTIWVLIATQGLSQPHSQLCNQLDSISRSEGIERHFAQVYVWATYAADKYISTLPDTPQILMIRLQENFAGLFYDGISDAITGKKNDVWMTYFKEKNLTPMQYRLLGTSNHINGDSWKVLTSSFTKEELYIIAPYYHHCTTELMSVLDSLHLYGIDHSRRMKLLHQISLGLDKPVAKKMLTKWRARQFEIALQYFDQPHSFEKLHLKTENKRIRMQRRIIHLVR
jgi:hypothetical protein